MIPLPIHGIKGASTWNCTQPSARWRRHRARVALPPSACPAQMCIRDREGIEPCIGVTTTAIKDTLNDSQPIPVTIEKILNEVARTYNVMPADIRGKKRNANVSAARQMTMYIIREVTGMSMEAIGQEFQRDHSTVVYSIKTMEENINRDQHLKEMCSDIMKNVRT